MITEALIDQMAAKCLLNDAQLDAALNEAGPKRIQTVNLHHLALADQDPAFAETIASADHITADGWPIVTLMRSRGVDPQRVTGSELVERMVSTRIFHGVRVAILGSDRHIGANFRGMLHNSGMQVEFRDHGHRDDWEPKRIARRLKNAKVELLLIAVTPPYGDRIGESIRQAGFKGVVINVGGSINMVTGTAQMAPEWARATKTEWIYRLVQEPRRLFRRYFGECLPVFRKHIAPLYLKRSAAPAELPASAGRIAVEESRTDQAA